MFVKPVYIHPLGEPMIHKQLNRKQNCFGGFQRAAFLIAMMQAKMPARRSGSLASIKPADTASSRHLIELQLNKARRRMIKQGLLLQTSFRPMPNDVSLQNCCGRSRLERHIKRID